jgi:hypothetical protein
LNNSVVDEPQLHSYLNNSVVDEPRPHSYQFSKVKNGKHGQLKIQRKKEHLKGGKTRSIFPSHTSSLNSSDQNAHLHYYHLFFTHPLEFWKLGVPFIPPKHNQSLCLIVPLNELPMNKCQQFLLHPPPLPPLY